MEYEIQIWQSLLIALWVGLVMTRSMGTMTLALRSSPLMTGLIVGLILGEVSQSIMIAAAIQLVYMGLVGPGGTNPSEPTVAAAIAIPTAVLGGLSAEAALAIAIPVGLLGSYLYQFRFFINTFLMSGLDKAVEDRNETKMNLYTIVLPIITALSIFMFVTFVAVQYGAPVVAGLLESNASESFIHVLEVVGGGLAAVGIAAAVYVIAKPNYMPFFILAYFLSVMLKDLNVNMTIYAIIGAVVAAIFVIIRKESAELVE